MLSIILQRQCRKLASRNYWCRWCASRVCQRTNSASEKGDRQTIWCQYMLMNPEADAIAQVVIDEGVKVVTTGAGNPSKYMEQWKVRV